MAYFCLFSRSPTAWYIWLHCWKMIDLFVLAESLAELLVLATAALHLHSETKRRIRYLSLGYRLCESTGWPIRSVDTLTIVYASSEYLYVPSICLWPTRGSCAPSRGTGRAWRADSPSRALPPSTASPLGCSWRVASSTCRPVTNWFFCQWKNFRIILFWLLRYLSIGWDGVPRLAARGRGSGGSVGSYKWAWVFLLHHGL